MTPSAFLYRHHTYQLLDKRCDCFLLQRKWGPHKVFKHFDFEKIIQIKTPDIGSVPALGKNQKRLDAKRK